MKTDRRRADELQFCLYPSFSASLCVICGEFASAQINLLDRLRAFDADEFLVEAAVEVGQLVRVEAHLVQDGGVQVLDVEAVLHREVAEFVRLADADAALDAAAGAPHVKP